MFTAEISPSLTYCCDTGTLDKLGDHAVVFQGLGDAIYRHHKVQDQIETVCTTAYLSLVTKKRIFLL